jgi:CopG family nickel-responsive transcriptional regulator
MPDAVARFTISIPPELLTTFDEVCASKGYTSRSEAVRDAIRDYLVSHDWSNGNGTGAGEVVGTITLVYDHDTRRLTDELLERQHRNHSRVLSSLHVHLDAKSCLEVVVVKGSGPEVTAFADELISLRGVKHGRLVCSTSAGGLP